MTDYHTDGTIVEGIIRIHIEERILQDTGGETDFVGGRVIVSVDGLRSHQPFVLIHRLAGLGYHFGMAPLVGTFHVCPVRVVFDFQCGVVFPSVGITNLHMEGSQFLQSFHLSGITHPGKILDTFAQTFLQVLHQSHHTLLGSSREIFLHVHLTYSFAQRAAYSAYRSLPARLHFLCTAHGAAVEVEVLFCHSIVQQACGRINQFPLQIKALLFNGQRIQNIGSSFQ